MARDPFHPRSGLRLPVGPSRKPRSCVICSEDRRRLTDYGLAHLGTRRIVARVAICEPCLTELVVPPAAVDPLDVTSPR